MEDASLFFCDAIGDHYTALMWFEARNGDRNVIDPPIVLMLRLQESCPTAPATYGIMNVEALLNGALLSCQISYNSNYQLLPIITSF